MRCARKGLGCDIYGSDPLAVRSRGVCPHPSGAGCWNLPPSVFLTDQQELQLKNIIPTGNSSQEECGWGRDPPEKLLYLWILILLPGAQLCTSPFS